MIAAGFHAAWAGELPWQAVGAMNVAVVITIATCGMVVGPFDRYADPAEEVA
jgi:hypothetical protein